MEYLQGEMIRRNVIDDRLPPDPQKRRFGAWFRAIKAAEHLASNDHCEVWAWEAAGPGSPQYYVTYTAPTIEVRTHVANPADAYGHSAR